LIEISEEGGGGMEQGEVEVEGGKMEMKRAFV